MLTNIARTVLLLGTLALSAFAVPDFSGHWKLNSQKSKVDESFQEERTIDHKDPNLSISAKGSYDGEEQESTIKFTTDGKESRNMIDGDPLFTVAHWDGDTLVCESTSISDTDTTELHDRWKLSADGKVLTVTRKQKVGSDSRDMVLVFDLI